MTASRLVTGLGKRLDSPTMTAESLTRAALAPGGLTRADAHALINAPESEVFASATYLRERAFGNRIEACFIINAKSGNCGMNCRFCSQSAHNSTPVETYPFLGREKLDAVVSEWEPYPVGRCGVVTSGGALSDDDVEELARFIESRRGKSGPTICGSLGRLKHKALQRLKEAGMTRLHHNLETSESFYPSVCTTQAWRDRLDTVREAVAAGLEVCTGGLFGLGETWEDRIDFAAFLKEEGIRNIPINFLYPHPGTPLGSRPVMEPEEALRIVSLLRHMLPEATLRVCGGRVSVLGERQYDIFAAGANAFMTGNYLTIAGQNVQTDMARIEQLGLEMA